MAMAMQKLNDGGGNYGKKTNTTTTTKTTTPTQTRAQNLAYKNGLNAGRQQTSYTPTYTAPAQSSSSNSSSSSNNNSSSNNGDYLKSYYEALAASINKQKQEKERLAAAKYQQLLKQANDNYNNSINQITKNNAYTNRWLKQNYGGRSGLGLSNSLRANTNYENNLYSALQSLNEAKLNAEADKYNNEAEATNEYLQNYNNYITSPMSNVLSAVAKSSIDDGSYKRYINKLFGA